MPITKTATFSLQVTVTPDFSMVASPSSAKAWAGQRVSFGVDMVANESFSGDVKLTILSGLPTGTVVTFLPGDTVTVAPGYPKSIQIQLDIPSDNSLAGIYQIVVQGESTSYNGS